MHGEGGSVNVNIVLECLNMRVFLYMPFILHTQPNVDLMAKALALNSISCLIVTNGAPYIIAVISGVNSL